jgi:hypothetical protein
MAADNPNNCLGVAMANFVCFTYQKYRPVAFTAQGAREEKQAKASRI